MQDGLAGLTGRFEGKSAEVTLAEEGEESLSAEAAIAELLRLGLTRHAFLSHGSGGRQVRVPVTGLSLPTHSCLLAASFAGRERSHPFIHF